MRPHLRRGILRKSPYVRERGAFRDRTRWNYFASSGVPQTREKSSATGKTSNNCLSRSANYVRGLGVRFQARSTTSSARTHAGAVISGLDIRGTVFINAPNVTLQNCKDNTVTLIGTAFAH